MEKNWDQMEHFWVIFELGGVGAAMGAQGAHVAETLRGGVVCWAREGMMQRHGLSLLKMHFKW